MASSFSLQSELAVVAADDSHAGLFLLGLIAFLAGAGMPLVLDVGGELYAGEVVLALVAIFSIADSGGRSLFSTKTLPRLMLALMITLAGYVLSDMLDGSEPQAYLRGWSKLAMTAADAIALSWLVLKSPDLILQYAVGLAIGQSVAAAMGWGESARDLWKFGYGYPATVFTLSILPLAGRFLTVVLTGGLGLLHIMLDFRSLGAFCILTAVFLASATRAADRPSSLWRFGFLMIAGLAILTAVYQASNTYYEKRRSASNVARAIQLEVVGAAIGRSPIIGYGSWAPNSNVAREVLALGRAAGLQGSRHDDPSTIGPHSQLLQSWYEGGILGAAFFVYFALQLIKGLKFIASRAPFTQTTPLFCLALVWSLWAVAFSPFAGEERRSIALAAAALCACETMRNRGQEDPGLNAGATDDAHFNSHNLL